MSFEEAAYHLSYDAPDEQPIISLHTDPANLEGLEELEGSLAHTQEYLGIAAPFTFEQDAFGYEGVGHVKKSALGAGWVALELALPKAASDARYRGATTPQLLPIVSTFYVALNHLNFPGEAITAKDQPHLVMVDVWNRVPLNEHYSAPLRATLGPTALERLAGIQNIESAEELVRGALYNSFQYPYGHASEDEFRVSLGNEISFTYPGDGTGFFATRTARAEIEGLTLTAKNNDYPLQQIGILGGLAALNGILLEQQ